MNRYEDLPCEISFHSFLDQTKGIFYIQTYEFNDESGESLKIEYRYIENAIRTRNTITTAMLLTSNLLETPYLNIYIPGEPEETPVHKYQGRPLIYQKCYK